MRRVGLASRTTVVCVCGPSVVVVLARPGHGIVSICGSQWQIRCFVVSCVLLSNILWYWVSVRLACFALRWLYKIVRVLFATEWPQTDRKRRLNRLVTTGIYSNLIPHTAMGSVDYSCFFLSWNICFFFLLIITRQIDLITYNCIWKLDLDKKQSVQNKNHSLIPHDDSHLLYSGFQWRISICLLLFGIKSFFSTCSQYRSPHSACHKVSSDLE